MILSELTPKEILDAFKVARFEATRGNAIAVINFFSLFPKKAQSYPQLPSSALVRSILRLSDKISSEKNFLHTYKNDIYQSLNPALCGIANARLDLLVRSPDFRNRIEQIADGADKRRLSGRTTALARKALNRLCNTKEKNKALSAAKAYPDAPACKVSLPYSLQKIPEYESNLAWINSGIEDVYVAKHRVLTISSALEPFLWLAENEPERLSERARTLIKETRDKSTDRTGHNTIETYWEADSILLIAKEALDFPLTRPLLRVDSALRYLPLKA
ncbi:MAG: hypothetical protein WC464_04500 [Bdellovibrionales bacterium]